MRLRSTNRSGILTEWRQCVYCRRYASEMSQREEARKEFRGRSRRKIPEYPQDIRQESFNMWFGKAASEDVALGNDVSEDIFALLLPPRREAKGYKAMYAYGNHIRVRSAEVDMSTCDSGVAATFLQSCRSSSSDRNMRTANHINDDALFECNN